MAAGPVTGEEMSTAVRIVWWIGLAGALAATLVILKEVALVLRVLGEILHLASVTRGAAREIAINLDAVPRLALLPERARRLIAAHGALVSVGAELERHERQTRRAPTRETP